MRRGLFASISPDRSLHATSVFRSHPDYAAAFSAMTRMRSGLGVGKGAVPSMPLDRTYELYELWCYIGVLAAVADRFPDSRTKIAEILKGSPSPRGLGVLLARGDATVVPIDSTTLLTYQKRIGPQPSADGTRTLLLEVVPDITVSRIGSDGTCAGRIVLDPKY
jgi:hypothetical protein